MPFDLEKSRARKSLALVAAGETAIFALFYSVMLPYPLSGTVYPFYAVLTPVIIAWMFLSNRDMAGSWLKSLGNPDMFVLFFAILAWMYVFSASRINPYAIFWEQAFTDEFNFRLFLIPFLGKYVGKERATVIQSALFLLYYMGLLFFYPAGFPGIYYSLFIIDMFSMGVLYGVIYLVRNSIYIDLALHLSLYAMSFVVVSLGWIPYLFLPS
ncbi:MAG: CPBP family glutamic-type intramembrane protease [Candidatus Thermoplasmatota archaeon]|jgi:hypothetical protein|nr:CPBP family glutamic-type intramembrane protease [Candidatus Thermoplasmatota archaeon]MCL5800583.1 CPBP family glutamic-type intramembrane protease [Candidatus Thermoplasmatota archaeon]